MTNLINNAIKYSPGERLINIEISAEHSQKRISIADNGVGIAEHERERIFEKFYRIEDFSTLAAGSGIGLYLCSEIIVRHGGKIGVLAKPSGRGTLAFFSLPI